MTTAPKLQFSGARSPVNACRGCGATGRTMRLFMCIPCWRTVPEWLAGGVDATGGWLLFMQRHRDPAAVEVAGRAFDAHYNAAVGWAWREHLHAPPDLSP